METAILVAFIAAVASFTTFTINAIQKRRDFLREEFSKAFLACIAYEEFPYIVRRRKSSSQDERQRISTELHNIQQQIGYYSIWLASESKSVSMAYDTLVSNLRRIAGKQIHEAWLVKPIETDEEMNMSDLGMDILKPYKMDYCSAVVRHFTWPKLLRRKSGNAKLAGITHTSDSTKEIENPSV